MNVSVMTDPGILDPRRASGEPIPLKVADPDRLADVLARAEALARGRDPAADDAALAPFGDVDPVDWSVGAVRAVMEGRR